MNAHQAVKLIQAYLTVDDVAATYHVSRPTVYRAARNGLLKGRKVARHWEFLPHDAEKWAANGGPTQ